MPLRSSGAYPGSPKSRGTPMALAKACSSKGSRANSARSCVGERGRLVVEAGHGDPAFAIAKRSEDARECVGRVLDHATETAGVEILAGARDVELEVGVATQ